MKQLSAYPNTATQATGADYELATNETSPGAQDGTPVDAGLINDAYYGLYALIAAAGLVPSGSEENTTTSDVLDAVNALIGNAEMVFLPVTAGTQLTLSTAGAFNIQDFVGTGVDVDEIRAIHVDVLASANDSAAAVTATWPDGTVHNIGPSVTASSQSSSDYIARQGTSIIPVNKSQALTGDITFAVTGGAEFTIFGISQREFS